MIRDDHSGAVLFVRTPEEKRTDDMEEKVNMLESLVMKMAEGSIDPKEVKEKLSTK